MLFTKGMVYTRHGDAVCYDEYGLANAARSGPSSRPGRGEGQGHRMVWEHVLRYEHAMVFDKGTAGAFTIHGTLWHSEMETIASGETCLPGPV